MDSLISRFPGLENAWPDCGLTDLPTPLETAPNLAREVGVDRLLIKRDDLSARPYGGNKARKLDLLLADALDRRCDAVVTFGAVGSNHALATSIYCARLGLACHAILTDQPNTPYVASTLRYHARLGTRLIHADGYHDSQQKAEAIRDRHPGGPDGVYQVPWGGSSWLGVAAFVDAALELVVQLDGRELPNAIYLACGTMGTAVGLALGLRLAGLSTRIVAVQVVPEPVITAAGFVRLFERTNRELQSRDERISLFEDPLGTVDLRTEFLGPGYAEPTPECKEALELGRSTENMHLETTYTAKALAALIHDARAGQLGSGPVEFWNTYNSRAFPEDLAAVTQADVPQTLRSYLGNYPGD